MRQSVIKLGLFAVISLLFSAMCATALSTAPPSVEPLDQIREGLSVPTRIDVDAQGNLYVADPRKAAIVCYNKDGCLTRSFSSASLSGGGLAVTPDGSRLYVACGSAVAILSGANGELLGHLGAGEGEFGAAGFIDLDAAGFIFVADTQARIVKVYNPQGDFAYQFGDPVSASGKFPSIFALAVNSASGEVYVADSMRSTRSLPKVLVLDLVGDLVRTIPANTGFGSPSLAFFGGITFDDVGRGYFLNAACLEMRILALPDTFLLKYQNPGSSFGRWVDAAYDPTGKRLFVACENGRIEIFGIDDMQNPVRVNAEPGLPTALSPVADSEVTVVNPDLVFQNATDPDGDTLSYNVRLLKGQQLVTEYFNLPEGQETSSAQVDVALEENARHFWSVQAFDGEDVSGWTQLQSFFVNAVQQPPGVPVLVAPLQNTTLDGAGELAWQIAADPDPLDSVSYLVEVSADSSFATLVLDETVEGTTVALADLADYPALDDDQTYFWRVTAVDNHGLASEPSATGSFRYDTTILKVTANMPGAKVYLGGNHAYPGRLLGEVPLEIRDFSPGPCSVVIERSGFESYITRVWLGDGDNVALYAELVPAIAVADLKVRSRLVGGREILVGGDAAPFVVDFDSDGIIDLLTGDASGALTLFRGVAIKGEWHALTAGIPLDLPRIHGAAPFMVDWNNDGRKDLLVGDGDGAVTLFHNTATESAPAFDDGSFLQENGAVITVGAGAAPAVIDYDGDGAKDLVVGSASGAVLLFRNTGSDDAPQLAPAGTLLSVSGPAAPFFVDWDADGRKDLLLGTGEGLYLCVRQADGSFASAKRLAVDKNQAGKKGSKALSLGDRLHLFAFDADGKNGKDLLVGSAQGQVQLIRSNGREPVPAFAEALLDKISQVEQLVNESAPELVDLLTALAAAVEGGNFTNGARLAEKLATSAAEEPALATAAGELAKLLH